MLSDEALELYRRSCASLLSNPAVSATVQLNQVRTTVRALEDAVDEIRHDLPHRKVVFSSAVASFLLGN